MKDFSLKGKLREKQPFSLFSKEKLPKKKSLALFLASCCYIGYTPLAPGTTGALFGVAIFLLIRINLIAYILATICLISLGFLVSGKAEESLGQKDPKPVVIDDMTGVFVAFFLIPFKTQYLVFAFLLYRLIDIIKPYPIGKTEKLPGSLGIMLDDLLGALYANLLMHIALGLIPYFTG